MGRHRNSAARRSVSRGPVIALVVLVVVALVVFGWFRVRDNVTAQGASAAGSCVSGPSTLVVAASPTVAPVLTDLAERFTATKPVVRDHCIQVAVTTVNDDQALAGLQGNWSSATLGAQPAVWVPEDSSWTAQLAAAKPALLTDKIRSLVSSPILLAVPQPAAAAVSAAKLSWAQLPELQGNPGGWARFGQPGWGTSTIALPTGPGGAGTSRLTVQAVAAGVSGAAPVNPAVFAQPSVTAAIAKLRRGPTQEPAGTASALATLHGLKAVPGSAFQAVPATEQQIFAVAQQAGNTPLAGVQLSGPTPVADFPMAGLQAPWVDDTQSRAVGAFAEFVNQPNQRTALAAVGFRAGNDKPASSAAVSFSPVASVLPNPDAATSAAVTALLGGTP